MESRCKLNHSDCSNMAAGIHTRLEFPPFPQLASLRLLTTAVAVWSSTWHGTKRKVLIVVNTEWNTPAVGGAARVTTHGHTGTKEQSNQNPPYEWISTAMIVESSRVGWHGVKQLWYHVPNNCRVSVIPHEWRVYDEDQWHKWQVIHLLSHHFSLHVFHFTN